MHEIGKIVAIQIQTQVDAESLISVPKAFLAPNGVTGVQENGEEIQDIRHSEHPETIATNESKPLHMTFTNRYAEIREQFGEHVTDGMAGEHIIVQVNYPFDKHGMGNSLVLHNQQNGKMVRLVETQKLEATLELANFIKKDTIPEAMSEAAVEFLAEKRGYSAQPQIDEAVEVNIGDVLYVVGVPKPEHLLTDEEKKQARGKKKGKGGARGRKVGKRKN
jgi:hypothetical protein